MAEEVIMGARPQMLNNYYCTQHIDVADFILSWEKVLTPKYWEEYMGRVPAMTAARIVEEMESET